jgi:hypothetical protein
MSARAAGPGRGRRHGAGRARLLGTVSLLTLATAGLAACGGAAADPGPVTVGSPQTAAAPAAGPTVAASAPTALPQSGELDSRCADEFGDGVAHDLAGVELVRAADVLVAAFTLTVPPVSGGSFLTVELHDTSGAAVRQLGIELDGAQPVAAYVATSPSAPVQRLDDTVHVEGAEVHAAFPAAVLDDLGAHWGWLASIGTESAVEDVCAAGGTPDAPVAVVIP